MKRIFTIIMTLALVVSFADGCKKDKKKGLDVTGVWELTDVAPVTKAATIGSETVEVFIEFVAGGNFTIYQRMGAGAFKTYTGTWTLTGNILDGVYSDKKAWGSTYTVERDGDTMNLTSAGECYVYTKTDALPDLRL